MKPFLSAAALLSLVAWAAAVAAAEPAAEINLITGKGTATQGATVRPLAKGDPVYPGEMINSGPASYVNLKFADGAFVLIRPNSRFHIEDYAFVPPAAPEPAKPATAAPSAVVKGALPTTGQPTGRAFFRLLKGGFRAVSGLVGKLDRNEYRVATPVATIGIRGTDYTAVICDAACANDPVVRADVAEGTPTEGGLVAGVVSGQIAVASDGKNCDKPNEKGECILSESQYMLVAQDGSQTRLDGPPRFLEVDPTPNPTTCAP
ncbi:MAG TPA: hypothetical protein VJM11_20940 [Nevskiaceae bacterium]|nr:hypothetical protein [Nevskiaceae bacterium]